MIPLYLAYQKYFSMESLGIYTIYCMYKKGNVAKYGRMCDIYLYGIKYLQPRMIFDEYIEYFSFLTYIDIFNNNNFYI